MPNAQSAIFPDSQMLKVPNAQSANAQSAE